MIIQFDYNSLNLSIMDFLIIFLFQMFFFIFMRDKIQLKDNIETILLSNLLSIGLLSLFLNWIPFYVSYSIKNLIILTTLLFFLGCIISTMIFKRDLLLSKNESFNLSFQLNIIGSLAFFTFNLIQMPDYVIYYLMSDTNTTGMEKRLISDIGIVNLNAFLGSAFLVLAVIILIYKNNKKVKQSAF